MIVEESDDDFAASLKLAPLHQTDSNSKVKWKITYSHYNPRVVDLVVQLRIQYFTISISFQEKILQIFDNEIWNSFFSNAQDTWNYIVINFSATQLHPYLKANDLNVQGDAMTPS